MRLPTLISLAIVLVAWAWTPVRASPSPKPPLITDAARVLAENVLGRGMVKSVRSSADGSEILIRWESPTYHPDNGLVANRELMYSEAILATNSIMGQLQQVRRIRFTILNGARMLATGENRRGRGVALMLSRDLGGGAYLPPAKPAVDQPTAPTGGTAQEI